MEAAEEEEAPAEEVMDSTEDVEAPADDEAADNSNADVEEYVEKIIEVKKERKIKLTLNGPKIREMNQDEVKAMVEPGFSVTEEGDEPDDVEVYFSQPADMRNGVPGTYTVTYTAEIDGEVLASEERTIIVTDIDECDEKDPKHECDANAICINTIGSYECECKKGFKGPGRVCADIDECEEGTHDCPAPESFCRNTVGWFACVCSDGYRDEGDEGRNCVDIDECAVGEHNNCHKHAKCINLPGTFDCECNDGWFGNGVTCEPENPCDKDNDCVENAQCQMHADGSYDCICEEPQWEGDGRVECIDVDECARGIYHCPEHSECRNTQGGYECDCHTGLVMKNNVCVDVNECDPLKPLHDCHPTLGVCHNTFGSFHCTCKDGYKGDGHECKDDHKPHLMLDGDNPLRIMQYDSFREPGFTLSDESRNSDDLRVSVLMPKELESPIIKKVFNTSIRYKITFGENGSETKFREVQVVETNRCLLPEDNPYTHDCDRLFAECIWDSAAHDYTCKCFEGYGGDGRTCKDNLPPYIEGPSDPYYLTQCQICEEDVGRAPDPTLRLGTGLVSAWDPLPNASPQSVAFRETVESINATHAVHTFTAEDEAGNQAEPLVLNVIVVVKDMRTEIERMNATINHIDAFLNKYHADFESFRGTQEVQTGRLSAFTYWVIGMLVLVFGVKVVLVTVSKLFLLYNVQSSSKPVWADFEEAWSFYLRARHPFWSATQITEEVFQMWAAREQ